jgi:hypothetical protein
MSTDQRRPDSFEERLLGELRNLAVAESAAGAERPRWPKAWIVARPRRRVALVGGSAALLATAVAVGAAFLTAGAGPAYAVDTNDDGTVTVEINSLGDADGLQTKLREAGIPAVVQYLPPRKACNQPWFTPAQGGSPGGEIKGGVEHTTDGHTRFTISRNLPADLTLVIMTQTAAAGSRPDGAESVGVALAQGEVEQCHVVDAQPGSQPFPPKPGAGLHTEGGVGQGPSTLTRSG